MYISSLTVRNFRSIDYINLKFFPGKNVIVGKNNSGKSNIIKALNLILGDKYPTYNEITNNDFHESNGNASENFWILCNLKGSDIDEGTFSSIKGQYRGKLNNTPFVTNVQGQVELVLEECIFKPDEYSFEYGAKKWLKDADIEQLRIALHEAKHLALLFYVCKSETDEDEYDKDFRVFYKDSNSWYALWGISNQFRDSLLTSAILPAFRDPTSQLRITNYSWYGKLLKKAWETKRSTSFDDGVDPIISLQEKLNEAYQQVNLVGTKVFGDLSEDIKKRLDVAFKDIELAFNFFVSKGDVHKQTQIYINDGFDSLLQDKGSGIQSAVLIGLFSYYCSFFHCNTTLLAIEEPELYLHPQARRVISLRLSEFVKIIKEQDASNTKQNQVLITTHSSEFIRAGELSSIIVIRKEDGKTKAFNYPINFQDKKSIQTLLRNENSEMFFADKVIICEGGEKYILPCIADFLVGKDNILDESNITIVRASGKGDIIKYQELLKACNIPCFVIADLDYLFEGLNQELDDQISLLRSEASKILSSEGDKLKANQVIKKLLNPSNGYDAKAFCMKMEALKNGHGSIDDVLDTWEFISPRTTKKLTMEMVNSSGNEIFKQSLTDCLKRLWDTYDIYILNQDN